MSPRRVLLTAALALLLPASAAHAAGVAGSAGPPTGAAAATLAGLQVSDDPTDGTVTVRVPLADPAAPPYSLRVTLGQIDATGACAGPTPLSATLFAQYASWTGTADGSGLGIERFTHIAGGALASAITAPVLRGRTFTCATATAPDGSVLGPIALAATDGPLPAPIPHAPTLVQPDYPLHGGTAVVAGRARVSLTCVTAAASRCHGTVSLRSQFTHISLGSAHFSLALGRSTTVLVPIRAGVHLEGTGGGAGQAFVTVTPLDGPRVTDPIGLTRR